MRQLQRVSSRAKGGLLALLGWAVTGFAFAAEPSPSAARHGMQRATEFFREHCSASGGYVFRISADLKLREGESRVGATTAWIEPPATPAVGAAYLKAYQLTGEDYLLQAAQATAEALLQGQLLSGGWTEQIEFAPADRRQYAYRVEGDAVNGRRNTTTFDDNKTQASIRFLMKLDQQAQQRDARLHEAVTYALEAVLRAQYANGAWPQKIEGEMHDESVPNLSAQYPDQWSREFPNQRYTGYYTLNDSTLCDLIHTMLEAGELYDEPRYTESALRGGEFLLRAQMPMPQPGWAQQYNPQMQPAWARKFEPPAITGGEAQEVMRTLLVIYRLKPDQRYLEAVERGLTYYRSSLLPDGRLARFYELHTNRPLYFTRDYVLTYEDNDLPTHYGFKVGSSLDSLARELKKLQQAPTNATTEKRVAERRQGASSSLQRSAAEVLEDLDERGAWVEAGSLRTHPDAQVDQIISSATFARNLLTLAEYIAATAP